MPQSHRPSPCSCETTSHQYLPKNEPLIQRLKRREIRVNMALELGDLPNELLIKIFHRNRLSNDDMCTVARTCKHFSKVAIPLIYSNVKVKRRANDKRTFGLIQTITDNPSRAELILKLSFSWSNNGTTFREDQERIVQFLLRRTTRLQILKLKVITLSQYATPFPVVSGAFLDVNPMTALRRVEVAYVNITVSHTSDTSA